MMLVGAVLALTVTTSNAPAAKGVKKTAEHEYHGTVVAVHKHAAHHTLTIRFHHPKTKKKGQAAAAKAIARANAPAQAQKPRHHTFTVNHKTHFETKLKGSNHPASLGAIHLGEHVVVFAHHHHADKVVIVSHSQQPQNKKKTKSRKT
jgi:hypothetical protein